MNTDAIISPQTNSSDGENVLVAFDNTNRLSQPPASVSPEVRIEDPPVHRKIAKLPKPLRDLINTMLDDGCPAREIIARLESSKDPSLPYSISEMNISVWRNTGYQRYLAQQERMDLFQANSEGATDFANTEPTTIPEATLQIVANQYFELMLNFSPESLREKFSEDPMKYTRFLNVFARLVREIVHLRKFRDASRKEAAAAQQQLKKLDPDRDLSDSELDLLVNRMDRVFKVARPRKPEQRPNPNHAGRAGSPQHAGPPPSPCPGRDISPKGPPPSHNLCNCRPGDLSCPATAESRGCGDLTRRSLQAGAGSPQHAISPQNDASSSGLPPLDLVPVPPPTSGCLQPPQPQIENA